MLPAVPGLSGTRSRGSAAARPPCKTMEGCTGGASALAAANAEPPAAGASDRRNSRADGGRCGKGSSWSRLISESDSSSWACWPMPILFLVGTGEPFDASVCNEGPGVLQEFVVCHSVEDVSLASMTTILSNCKRWRATKGWLCCKTGKVHGAGHVVLRKFTIAHTLVPTCVYVSWFTVQLSPMTIAEPVASSLPVVYDLQMVISQRLNQGGLSIARASPLVAGRNVGRRRAAEE